ncbi:hypothetical protein M071_1346, partial [Bacteroides fragilis str. Ds-233]
MNSFGNADTLQLRLIKYLSLLNYCLPDLEIF